MNIIRRHFEQSTTADVPSVPSPGLGEAGEKCVVDGLEGIIVVEAGIKYCRVPKKDSEWEREKQIFRVKALLGKYKDWAERKGHLTFLSSSVLREFIKDVGLTDYEYNLLAEEMGFTDSLRIDQEDKPKYEPRAGDYCTIDGKLGKLVSVSGSLVCDIGEKGKEAKAEAASFFLRSNKFQYSGTRIKQNKLRKAIDSFEGLVRKSVHRESFTYVLLGPFSIYLDGVVYSSPYGGFEWLMFYIVNGEIEKSPTIKSGVEFASKEAAINDMIDYWSLHKKSIIWG